MILFIRSTLLRSGLNLSNEVINDDQPEPVYDLYAVAVSHIA